MGLRCAFSVASFDVNALTMGCSAVYAAIILSHAFVCCLGTQLLARLQSVYVILNVLYVLDPLGVVYAQVLIMKRLCLAVIVALPAATPSELKNSASFALGNFTNGA